MNVSDPRFHLKLKPARPFISVQSAILADATLLATIAGAFLLLVA